MQTATRKEHSAVAERKRWSMPGPKPGTGGRPRKAGGSKLSKGPNKGYVKVTVGPKGKGTQKYKHRVVTGAPAGKVVDHKDNKKSNNKRSNLKVTTRGKNTGRANKNR